jgi:hypothetical protein
MIDHYRAAVSCDLADYNLLVEVAHTITDPHVVKVDFPWKLTTHGPLMLAGSQAVIASRARAWTRSSRWALTSRPP